MPRCWNQGGAQNISRPSKLAYLFFFACVIFKKEKWELGVSCWEQNSVLGPIVEYVFIHAWLQVCVYVYAYICVYVCIYESLTRKRKRWDLRTAKQRSSNFARASTELYHGTSEIKDATIDVSICDASQTPKQKEPLDKFCFIQHSQAV